MDNFILQPLRPILRESRQTEHDAEDSCQSLSEGRAEPPGSMHDAVGVPYSMAQ
jgi:hypothetical protein